MHTAPRDVLPGFPGGRLLFLDYALPFLDVLPKLSAAAWIPPIVNLSHLGTQQTCIDAINTTVNCGLIIPASCSLFVCISQLVSVRYIGSGLGYFQYI